MTSDPNPSSDPNPKPNLRPKPYPTLTRLVNEWNKKMAAITGFSKDEVMGQDLVEQYITCLLYTSPSPRDS